MSKKGKYIKIAILGYGIEGKSALKFLKKRYPKAHLEIRDAKLQGRNYLKNLKQFAMVVRSPGIPYLLPEIQKAKKAGVEVTSAAKLFFENAPGLLIGITGTKGKGTTATLLYQILKAGRKDTHLIGNMGIPMLDELPVLKPESISVLELSSFQLQDLNLSPHISVILDVSPDHLNYHKTMKEYLSAKAQIVRHNAKLLSKFSLSLSRFLSKHGKRGARLRPENLSNNLEPQVFYFPSNKFSKEIAMHGKGVKIPVSADKSLKLRIPGAHNIKNASMAEAVGRALGVKRNIRRKIIADFRGLPHRLEFIREIRGVRFYNDSASTNPAATAAALHAFKAPKILIAGGAGKNLSYKPLKIVAAGSNIKLAVFYGQNKREIGRAVGKSVVLRYAENLKSAFNLAKSSAVKGDIVLFSPASTAFDQFSGYGARGAAFKKLVSEA